LYDVEYKLLRYIQNEQKETELVEEYYQSKWIDQTVKVEPFIKTGYSRFTIIPFMHTPRKSDGAGRRPMGIPARVKSSQDLRNILRSIMLDVAKGSTKHLAIITGARDSDVKNWDSEAAKPNGHIAIPNENARVHFVPDRQLPPSLVQFDQMNRLSFDENAGDYAPERGQNDGDLSGKAISLLNAKGQLGQFVARENLEASFEEIGNLIIETIRGKMTNPFVLYDILDGEELEVHYNTPIQMLPPDYQPNPMEVVDEEGMINNVKYFPQSGSEVKIDLNAAEKEQQEQQKAMIAFERQILSRKDFTKALYPEEWIDLYKNKTLEDQALQLVEKIMQGGPEFAQLANEQIDRLASIMQQQQQQQQRQPQGAPANRVTA
jgi:hypothetical protein